VDGFTTDVGTPTATGTTISLSDTAFQGRTAATEFRLYGWGGTSAAGTYSVNDFAFSGAVSANFWVGDDSTRGGAGTWAASGGTAWAATDSDTAGGAFRSDRAAVFGGSSTSVNDVTISGAVSADAGILFQRTGYTLSGGTLNLGGATGPASTITTDSGVIATIGSTVTGSNGLTKAGPGTLVLSGANSYSGGTTKSGGSLVVTNTTGSATGVGGVSGRHSPRVHSRPRRPWNAD
jgi:autotransporter-associated beta strand protein